MYPKFLTIRGVAKTGVLPEHTIRTMVKTGKCPGFYVGKRYYVNFDKLVETLNGEGTKNE